jgi:hypothetical protein
MNSLSYLRFEGNRRFFNLLKEWSEDFIGVCFLAFLQHFTIARSIVLKLLPFLLPELKKAIE